MEVVFHVGQSLEEHQGRERKVISCIRETSDYAVLGNSKPPALVWAYLC